MKTALLSTLVAACLVACGGAPTTTDMAAYMPPEQHDAGVDVAVPDAPLVAPDAGGYRADGAAPDAGPMPDAASADGHTSEGPDAAPDAGAEAAAPDAGPDAAPPVADAAGGGEAGPAPICSAPDPSCKAAVDADNAIQGAFPPARFPCGTEGTRQCGTLVQDGIPVTYPMICRSGAWRLSGGISGGRWIGGGECSKSCGVGKICDP